VGFFDAQGLELVARAAEIREMDRRTIDELALPGRVLMELAGSGSAKEILARVPRGQGRATVLCGPGGNGGDGYVVARHLQDAGWSVRCISTVDAAELRGDTAANRGLWDALDGETLTVGEKPTSRMRHHLGHANVIVDGLFGTGQSRGVAPAVDQLLEWANEAKHGTRVALDLPTGIHADTGAPLGRAFAADLTTTYGLPTAGLFQGAGARHSGQVVIVPVGIPRSLVDSVGATSRRLTHDSVRRLLPERPRDGHKGTFGHVGIVGGSPGMEGASALAARAALRVGAGLVTWNMPPSVRRDMEFPEVMGHDTTQGLDDRSDLLVVGPGLGTDASAQHLLELAFDSGRPLVCDAGALTVIAERELEVPPGSILTPHPGEAARLLGLDTATVQADRLDAATRLVERFRSTIVLKGAGTLVASPCAPTALLDIATPALAVAGTGDVLAGVIAGLWAQGLSPLSAAHLAVWLHGTAGQRLGSLTADRGVLASELADAIPETLARLEASA
jgi:ADP-dependent NAD(P)H-hydrate dehydratase / NAD(P)H-hydrate epimerase